MSIIFEVIRVNLSVTTLVFFMTKNVNDIGKWAIVWIRLVEKRLSLGEVIGDRMLKMQHRWCIWPLWTISFIKCLTRKLSGRFFFLLRLLSAKEVSHNSLVQSSKGTEKNCNYKLWHFCEDKVRSGIVLEPLKWPGHLSYKSKIGTFQTSIW